MAFGLAVYASPPGLPQSTQDSLPAVGQTLLDGLRPAGFLRKVSECFVTSHPPSPSFAWRNHIDRSSERQTVSQTTTGRFTGRVLRRDVSRLGERGEEVLKSAY